MQAGQPARHLSLSLLNSQVLICLALSQLPFRVPNLVNQGCLWASARAMVQLRRAPSIAIIRSLAMPFMLCKLMAQSLPEAPGMQRKQPATCSAQSHSSRIISRHARVQLKPEATASVGSWLVQHRLHMPGSAIGSQQIPRPSTLVRCRPRASMCSHVLQRAFPGLSIIKSPCKRLLLAHKARASSPLKA